MHRRLNARRAPQGGLLLTESSARGVVPRADATGVGADIAASVGHETIAVLDFGSQYSQLIARRIREVGVRTELLAPDQLGTVDRRNLRGIVLSGGPASVYAPGAPQLPADVLDAGVPILGICYGMQLLSHSLGGRVQAAARREYGPARVRVADGAHPLFAGLPPSFDVWMSHGDVVEELPPGFRSVAATAHSPTAAMSNGNGVSALQFHPEVRHTSHGLDLLRNFARDICGCRGDWTPASLVREAIGDIRRRAAGARVICGLSGGVDSAVTAALVHAAIGDRLTCILIDTGLLRADEVAQVRDALHTSQNLDLSVVDAAEEFLRALQGVTDPERKRAIIGEAFIRAFEREAGRIDDARFLAQGTIYPDVIESGGRVGAAVPVLRIAMVADGQLGKLSEVPVKAQQTWNQADPIGPVSQCQSQQEIDQAHQLPWLLPHVKVLPAADCAAVDPVPGEVCPGEPQGLRRAAGAAGRGSTLLPRSSLALSIAAPAQKGNAHGQNLMSSPPCRADHPRKKLPIVFKDEPQMDTNEHE